METYTRDVFKCVRPRLHFAAHPLQKFLVRLATRARFLNESRRMIGERCTALTDNKKGALSLSCFP